MVDTRQDVTSKRRRERLTEAGWELGTSLEVAAAHQMRLAGIPAASVEQQYRLGKYRLDFAFLDIKVALEVDGWQHRSPDVAAKDMERDSYLRAIGWVTLRVDDRRGPEGFADQVATVRAIVHVLRKGYYTA